MYNDLMIYAKNQNRSIETTAQSSKMMLAETMLYAEETQKQIEASSSTFSNLKISAENISKKSAWQILVENAWESKKTVIAAILGIVMLMITALLLGMSMGAKRTITNARAELSTLNTQIKEKRELAAQFQEEFPILTISRYGTPKQTVIELPKGMKFQKSVSLNGLEAALNKRNFWEIN